MFAHQFGNETGYTERRFETQLKQPISLDLLRKHQSRSIKPRSKRGDEHGWLRLVGWSLGYEVRAGKFRMTTDEEHRFPAVGVYTDADFKLIWLANALNLAADKLLKLGGDC